MPEQTCESIMAIFEKDVANNLPIPPSKWCEGALRINTLSGSVDKEIATLEAMLNRIEAEYLKTDMTSAKAKVLARSEIDYQRYLEMVALRKRITNWEIDARKRASISDYQP